MLVNTAVALLIFSVLYFVFAAGYFVGVMRERDRQSKMVNQ